MPLRIDGQEESRMKHRASAHDNWKEMDGPHSSVEGGGLSRREVLAMAGAVGAGIALSSSEAAAQTPGASPRIIDTHHHIYPPEYTKRNLDRIVADAPQLPGTLYTNWTPHTSLDQMDQNGVATAIASVSSPAMWTGNNEEARRNARECNEYGAQLGRDFLGRFGMWGALPLPDVEGSLREIEHVLDVLKLDGIGLLTSYDGGKLLGHKQFAPVMDELNRRKAAIFVHPTVSCCGHPDPMVSGPPIEFPVDTTRTIFSLIYTGTIARCPDLRFIFSHGGGTTLMLTSRLAGGHLSPEEKARIIPNGFIGELRKFYYDIASVAVSAPAMAAVFNALPKDHLLFGSDIPFWKIETIATGMNNFSITPGELRGIQRENALQLLPRWRT
jgi:6-methylsalicylate decarboxylase